MTSTLSKGDNGFVTFTFILSGPGATTDDHSAKFPSVEGASIVANITNVENAKNSNVTFTQCNPGTTDAETRVRQLGATNSTTAEVGKLFVIDSNCLTVEVSAPNSKNGRLDIEAALIGDFCKRSPSADVCEKYDPGVVMPADTEVEEFEIGGSDAGSDNDVTDDIKETPKPSSSPAPSSARRASVLLSLAVASLAIGATVV